MSKVFRKYYHYILNNKWLFSLFILLVILSGVAFNLSPYFYRLFVEAIPSLNQNYLLTILAVFIAVRILGVILDVIAFIIGDIVLFEGAKNARVEIFEHVSNLDFAFHTEKSTGSLISAFKRGDGAFFSFFHDIHARVFSVFIGFVVMLFFLIKLDPMIVILVTISLILTVIAAKFLVANNVVKRKIFNKEEDAISGIITDNLINFATDKVFAKEKWEADRLRASFAPWTKTLWGYANTFRVIDVTMGTLITISMFFILYLSIGQAVNLKLNIGDFVLITGFLGGFYPKLWDLVWSTRDLAKNYADIDKYFGLLDYQIEVLDPVNPIVKKHVKGKIEFNNIFHSYKNGTKNAINNFNLTISPGESVAFVGPSGSGKTTITKLLMRFFDPNKGTVKIDGINIKKFTKTNLRGFFGIVPQEPVLFNNTIEYNIGYGTKWFAKGRTLSNGPIKGSTLVEVRTAAKLANINEFIEKLPNKYKSNVGERGVKLSGGQKQRLAIARMILSNPDIVIFDEATSQLDSESEKLIQDAFWKARAGKTTIIVAHRLSTIMRADKIVVMERGKIKEIGTHQSLLDDKNSLYSHFWNLQVKLD